MNLRVVPPEPDKQEVVPSVQTPGTVDLAAAGTVDHLAEKEGRDLKAAGTIDLTEPRSTPKALEDAAKPKALEPMRETEFPNEQRWYQRLAPDTQARCPWREVEARLSRLKKSGGLGEISRIMHLRLVDVDEKGNPVFKPERLEPIAKGLTYEKAIAYLKKLNAKAPNDTVFELPDPKAIDRMEAATGTFVVGSRGIDFDTPSADDLTAMRTAAHAAQGEEIRGKQLIGNGYVRIWLKSDYEVKEARRALPPRHGWMSQLKSLAHASRDAEIKDEVAYTASHQDGTDQKKVKISRAIPSLQLSLMPVLKLLKKE